MIDPIKHPRRYAEEQDRRHAERLRVLAPSLTAQTAGRRLGIGAIKAEQLGAKFGFSFVPAKKSEYRA